MKIARPRRPPAPPEAEVQKSAMAVLESLGWVVHRRNVMAMRGEHKGKRWFVRNGEPGQSDLYGMTPAGFHFECEIKRHGEWPRPDQIAWLRRMNGIGGSVAFWVDNTRDLEEVARHVMRGGKIEFAGDSGQYRLVSPRQER